MKAKKSDSRGHPALPAGFKPITALGSSWKPTKKGDHLRGILRNVRTVHMKKQGKRPARDVQVYTLHNEQGDTDVWESAGLRALATVKKGREVTLIYLGLRKIPGSKFQPMRDFLVGVK